MGRAAGRRAHEMMSAPALVARPETLITRAAELMQTHHVKRLPVVDDERRLLGIVARSDLLEVFLEAPRSAQRTRSGGPDSRSRE